MSKTPRYSSLLYAALIASPAGVASTASLQNDPLIVTASATGIEAEKLGRAWTVIDGAQLQRQQIRYVSDALRQVPGLAVSRAGSAGGLTQVRVRGGEANHVLLLIDGMEVSEAGEGEYDLSALQVSNIQRIEILRGPQSAFWGSNASSGVINIITQGGTDTGQQVSLNTELGSDQTRQLGLALRGGSPTLDYSLSGALRRSDGLNISDFGSEEDGDRNRTLQGRAHLALSKQLDLSLNSRYVSRASDNDDQDFAFPATATQGRVIDTFSDTATREWANSLRLNWHKDALSQQLKLEHNRNDRRGLNGFGPSGSDSSRQKLAYQLSYAFDSSHASHSLTGGVEHEREQYRNTAPTSPDQVGTRKRALTGYILQYQGEYAEQLFISAAARLDNNDQFDNSRTFSLSAAWRLNDAGLKLHSSVGTGVTNPTFSEQFGYSPSFYVGNPDLKPEQNTSWDLGLTLPVTDDSTLDISWFEARLEDEISTVYDSNFIGSPVNRDGNSRRQGLELALNGQLTPQLSATASYTQLLAQEANGVAEVRRPQHSAALSLSYQPLQSRSRLFLNTIYNGSMDDLEFISATPESRVKLKHYWQVTLGADYQLSDRWQLYGRVENLFDREYEEIFDHNSPPRTFYAGARSRF